MLFQCPSCYLFLFFCYLSHYFISLSPSPCFYFYWCLFIDAYLSSLSFSFFLPLVFYFPLSHFRPLLFFFRHCYRSLVLYPVFCFCATLLPLFFVSHTLHFLSLSLLSSVRYFPPFASLHLSCHFLPSSSCPRPLPPPCPPCLVLILLFSFTSLLFFPLSQY